jgi:hypothetical protein
MVRQAGLADTTADAVRQRRGRVNLYGKASSLVFSPPESAEMSVSSYKRLPVGVLVDCPARQPSFHGGHEPPLSWGKAAGYCGSLQGLWRLPGRQSPVVLEPEW